MGSRHSYQGVTKKSKLNVMTKSATLEKPETVANYYKYLNTSWTNIRLVTGIDEKYRFVKDDITIKGKYAGHELVVDDLEEVALTSDAITRYTLKMLYKDVQSGGEEISVDLCGGGMFSGDGETALDAEKALEQTIALQDETYKIKLVGMGGENQGYDYQDTVISNFAFVNSETNEQLALFEFNAVGTLSHLFIKEGVQLKYNNGIGSVNYLTDKGVDLHFIYNSLRKI